MTEAKQEKEVPKSVMKSVGFNFGGSSESSFLGKGKGLST